MADEEGVEAPRQLSIAEALKEGVKNASQGGMTSYDDLDGASKAAVVLLAVGAEAGAEVLRQMTPMEVQKLSGKMAVVRSLSRDLVLEVLREFKESTSNNAQVSFDTDSFMQNMLTKAMGAEGASDLLGRLESTLDMSGIETLKRMESDVLYEMIKGEHPQIIATVMVFLEAPQAASVAKKIRDAIASELSEDVANKTRILYGGSVKAANVAGFLRSPEVDGVLVGGASLDAVEFSGIARFQKHLDL